jgi:hypothetical protein
MAVLRDLAIILIAVEAFVLALVPLVLFGALVYSLGWLGRHENLPGWLKLAQAYVALAQAYVEMAMAIVVRPILFINSISATIRRWLGGVAKVGGDNQ